MLADDTYLGYLAGMQKQEIELATLDMAQSGIVVDGVYFYKNDNAAKDFMSTDLLARSFYKLVADHYPIMIGRPIINEHGKGVMAVDPSNPCLLDIADIEVEQPAEYFFTTRPNENKGDPEVEFFDLRKFYRQSGVPRLPQASIQRDNSLAIVRMLRFRNSPYMAFSFSISHVIFDGISTIDFMNHWAEYARNFAQVESGKYKLAEPPMLDRQIINKYFDNVEPLELPFIEHFKSIFPPLSMGTAGSIAPILFASPDVEPLKDQHVLHFKAGALEQLRNDVDPQQTVTSAMTALLTKCITQANTKVYGSVPQAAHAMIAYDSRGRTDIPRRYAGNTSCTAIAPLSPQMILESSYKDLAATIKQHSSLVEGGHTKSAINVIENNLGLLYQASFALCNTDKSAYFGLSNVRYMPFHTIDFGYGVPRILSFDYFTKDGLARLLPNFQDGGVDLFLNYRDENFEVLCQLEDIAKYADVIY
ncbi:hypothetical protein GGI07_003692 [Coemansia sp. Benny D115]|nr:hypothetical protein GGI07_003692 [Coemansia sp. Benny D115]